MSTFAAKIDRFVRWFFNVSPTTTLIEPRPPRRRASSLPRRSRSASPKDRRDARPRPIGAKPALRAAPSRAPERQGGCMNRPALSQPAAAPGVIGTRGRWPR